MSADGQAAGVAGHDDHRLRACRSGWRINPLFELQVFRNRLHHEIRIPGPGRPGRAGHSLVWIKDRRSMTCGRRPLPAGKTPGSVSRLIGDLNGRNAPAWPGPCPPGQTSSPAWAKLRAMPSPMVPAPMTSTRETAVGFVNHFTNSPWQESGHLPDPPGPETRFPGRKLSRLNRCPWSGINPTAVRAAVHVYYLPGDEIRSRRGGQGIRRSPAISSGVPRRLNRLLEASIFRPFRGHGLFNGFGVRTRDGAMALTLIL